MTKQHFIALADFINHENSKNSGIYPEDTIESLADFCERQNPQFNRSRWLAYVKGECRPNGRSIKREKVTV